MIDPYFTVNFNGTLHRVKNNRAQIWTGYDWILSSKPIRFIEKQYKSRLKGSAIKDYVNYSTGESDENT